MQNSVDVSHLFHLRLIDDSKKQTLHWKRWNEMEHLCRRMQDPDVRSYLTLKSEQPLYGVFMLPE